MPEPIAKHVLYARRSGFVVWAVLRAYLEMLAEGFGLGVSDHRLAEVRRFGIPGTRRCTSIRVTCPCACLRHHALCCGQILDVGGC